jgi:hypothetical protein
VNRSLKRAGPVLLVATLASLPAHAQEAAQVFDAVRHAVFTVMASNKEGRLAGGGSAVLIAPGRFVTNCHVAEAAPILHVARKEDRLLERVRLATRDRSKDLCELDLVQMKPGFDRPVEIAPLETVRPGIAVYAVGSPRGLELTLSNGIVSAVREQGRVTLIQTTAPISPGSSGGGLFDSRGRLVAITTLLLKDSQNLNFAISARHIRSAGLRGEELEKSRAEGAALHPLAAGEAEVEEMHRLQGDEAARIEARKKITEGRPADVPAPPAAPERKAGAPVTDRLAPYQSIGDDTRPLKIYRAMESRGMLAGVDDRGIILRVYAQLIRERIAPNVKWKEGGDYAAEVDVSLRRNGDVMFVLPKKGSGSERFDKEAERAVGAASPLPVPKDEEAFAKLQNFRITVRAPNAGRAANPDDAGSIINKK